ncbi:MAG: hypothetical protein HQL69_09725 [Magnetococcales bacterium]|nr:hypothetical protein [Magnetococcales bacterium]
MAKIKCFNCEKEIGIQDKFCPFCSAEQKLVHSSKPSSEQKAPQNATPEHHPELGAVNNSPPKEPSAPQKRAVKEASKTVSIVKKEAAKKETAKKPIKKIVPQSDKKPADISNNLSHKQPLKQPDNKTIEEPVEEPIKEQTAKQEHKIVQEPDTAEVKEYHPKKHTKKRKKKGGVGCNTILLGVAALLILGYIVKTTFIDEKTAGIKLDGPGTYGRTASGKDSSKRSVKREANIKALIPNIKALRKKGKIEEAYQLAKRGVQNDSQNIELLTLLVQLAETRSQKAGNSLSNKDKQQAKTRSQQAAKSDLKQAATMLLNQLDSPCDRVLALGKTDTKGEIVATCSPTQNSNFTQSYVIDTNKGEAWEE